MDESKLLVRLARWVARCLPRSVVYWATIRLCAHATMGKYGDTNPNELSVIVALSRWTRDNQL